MCGILGGIQHNAKREAIEKSLGLISHRGPDTNGIYIHKNQPAFFLAAHRLAMVDPSHGNQPYSSEDQQQFLVFNGEIYNHNELREELETHGFVFKTRSDVEVAAQSIKHWGTEALGRWVGMWAFCYIDLSSRMALLARDHFGQKPLYYSHHLGGLIFSSELKPLLSLYETPPAKDFLALSQFLSFDYIPAPRTPYKGIYKLPAGHYLKLDLSSPIQTVNSVAYFDFKPAEKSGAVHLEELKEKFDTAVQRCLRADTPLAFALSGGLDSSSIVAEAQRWIARPPTYSLTFNSPSFDESKYARKAATAFSAESRFIQLDTNDMAKWFKEIFDRLDEPLGDSSLLTSYILSQDISKTYKGYLGGDGADELFAGYDPLVAATFKPFLDHLPFQKQGIQFLNQILPAKYTNMSWDFKWKRYQRAQDYEPHYWLPRWMSNVEVSDCNRIWGTAYSEEEDIYAPFLSVNAPTDRTSSVDLLMQQFLEVYLPNNILMVRDRASMLSSIECRSPYLDIEFAQAAMAVPSTKKINLWGKRKIIQKQIFKNQVPAFLLERKKKGFGAPLAEHLLNLKASEPHSFSVTTTRHFASQWKEHQSKRVNHKSLLWNSMILEHMGYYA